MPKRAASYRAWLGTKLSDPKIAAKYLSAALEDSPEMFLKALRKVAEVHQITKVAEEAGISRESLYRMTCETGNPTYASLGGILRALGLTLVIVPMEKSRPHT